MKKVLLFSALLIFAFTSCNNNNINNNRKKGNEIPPFSDFVSSKYGTDEFFLENQGFPMHKLQEIGYWIFNLGTEIKPLMNKVILYRDKDYGHYYILDKFEDGSKSLKSVFVEKRSNCYYVSFLEKSNDSYIIDGQVLRLKTIGYADELIGKGVFHEELMEQ